MKSLRNRTVPTVFFAALALVAVLLTGAWLHGAHRWKSKTQELRARLDSAREPVRPRTVDFRELDGLPDPVERYFRAALEEGRPMVSGVRVRHEGAFNMGETEDRWKPFMSDQMVVARRPGFDWNGRVAMAPGPPCGCTTPTWWARASYTPPCSGSSRWSICEAQARLPKAS